MSKGPTPSTPRDPLPRVPAPGRSPETDPCALPRRLTIVSDAEASIGERVSVIADHGMLVVISADRRLGTLDDHSAGAVGPCMARGWRYGGVVVGRRPEAIDVEVEGTR